MLKIFLPTKRGGRAPGAPPLGSAHEYWGIFPLTSHQPKYWGDVSPASPAGLTPVEKQFTIYVKCSCRSGRQADSVDTLVTSSSSSAVLQTRLTRTGDRLNWAHYDVCGTTSLRRRRCRCQPTTHCNKYHVTPQTCRRSFVSVVVSAQRCSIRHINTCRFRMVIIRYFGPAV